MYGIPLVAALVSSSSFLSVFGNGVPGEGDAVVTLLQPSAIQPITLTRSVRGTAGPSLVIDKEGMLQRCLHRKRVLPPPHRQGHVCRLTGTVTGFPLNPEDGADIDRQLVARLDAGDEVLRFHVLHTTDCPICQLDHAPPGIAHGVRFVAVVVTVVDMMPAHAVVVVVVSVFAVAVGKGETVVVVRMITGGGGEIIATLVMPAVIVDVMSRTGGSGRIPGGGDRGVGGG